MNSPKVVRYNDSIVKLYTLAALFWGFIGMLVGLILAIQLTYPEFAFDTAWSTFGRLRPVHTNGVIFAFGGNVLFATSAYVVQRTCGVRLFGSDWFLKAIFWGYQIFLVTVVYGYIHGITQSREYAEGQWLSNYLLVVVWVSYLLVYLKTIMRRTEPHIYVANWFYLAFLVVVAVLYVGNNISIPISWTTSVYVFSGVQSAMIQWWYGHNAVGFS